MSVTVTEKMFLSVSTKSMLVTMTYHINWHVSWTCI